MNFSTEQIAELLAGIARSQQAIIDAIESENGGWRNTHLLPKLNTAANMRLATSRLLDIPSRILLRSQGRVPMNVATISRALEEALADATATPPPTSTLPVSPTMPSAATGAPGAVVATVASRSAGTVGGDLDNFFES